MLSYSPSVRQHLLPVAGRQSPVKPIFRFLFFLLVVALSFNERGVFAYPSTERKPATQTQPPLDLGLQTAVGYAISDDNASLYVTSGESFKIVDLGTYALASSQPFAISGDTNLTGTIKGIGYFASLKKVYAVQEGGHVLAFDLAAITAKPTKTTVASGKSFSLAAADPDASTLYIMNTTDGQILRYAVGSVQATPIDVKSAISGSFTVNALLFVRNVSGSNGVLYASTNVGRVLAIPSTATTPTVITVDSGGTHDLKGMAALPNSTAVYVVDATDKTVRKIDTSSNSVTANISVSANSDVNQIVVADVTNPTATYGFVMGSKGVSVFNTSDNDVFDLGSTSTEDEPLAVSGTGPVVASTDGYLYLSFGKIAVVSDNPWVTISKVAYSKSNNTMASGETVTLTFEADETGTYAVRSGGTVAGTGTVLKDTAGATSGNVATANTAQTVTIPYDSNSSAFAEGTNTVYLFVTDSAGNVGRRATTVTVDTPPPAPTIQSVSFGTSKLYVNLQRLDVADIATYRVYADTNADTVKTTTTVAGTVSQPAAGNEPTVEVTGLTNQSLYYIAADVVDTNGNASAGRTSTFASGAVASGTPEATFGPAGFAGERGCTLIVPSTTEERPGSRLPSTVGWTFEMKGGIWLPTGRAIKQFFGLCCNFSGMMEGGYLLNGRYGFEVGAGGFYDKGSARGVVSGTVSQDPFNLFLVPVTGDLTFRGRFRSRQAVVPFVRAGPDMVFFRENDNGTVIKGIKWGAHGSGGAQFSLRWLSGVEPDFELGARDAYLVAEGRYNWINTFGKGGLDLSGLLFTLGILMEF